jgi:hypothetical protein
MTVSSWERRIGSHIAHTSAERLGSVSGGSRERDVRRVRGTSRVYEIRILDKDLKARATATGSANIRDFVTTLEAGIDASTLEPGEYQLTLRREGGEWQMFPLRVR